MNRTKNFPSPIEITKRSIGHFIAKIGQLTRVAGFPIVVILLLDFASWNITKNSSDGSLVSLFALFALCFLQIIPYVLLCVALHRSVLLKEVPESRINFSWRKIEWDFFWATLYLCLFYVLSTAFIITCATPFLRFLTQLSVFNAAHPGAVEVIVGSLLLLPMFYIGARVSLILPAAAVQRGFARTMSDSWKVTGAAPWKFPITLYLPLLPFYGIEMFLSEFLDMNIVPFSILYTVIGVFILSYSYQAFYEGFDWRA